MPTRSPALAAACFALLVALTACSSDGENGNASSNSSAAAGASAASVELTEASLGALERGMREELAIITSEDRAGSHYHVKLEAQDNEAQQVAAAAGMSVVEYRELRDAVDRVFTTLNFQGKIGPPTSVDLEQVSEEVRKRLESDPLSELSPASAEALRGSMDSLAPIWSEIMRHVALNG